MNALVAMNSSTLLSLSLVSAFFSFIALLPQDMFSDSRSDFLPRNSVYISIPAALTLPPRDHSLPGLYI